jgi:hypothetical protein
MNEAAGKCTAGGDNWCCLRDWKREASALCGAHQWQRQHGMELQPLRFRGPNGHKTKREKERCDFRGCTNKKRYGLYCGGHEKQKRLGQTLRPLRRWQPHPNPIMQGWGRPWTEKRGYAYVMHIDGRKQAEHRVVMEIMIGRELLPDENVHHINGDRADNRPGNLELWTTLQPPGQRIEDKLAYAWEIIRRYGPEAPKV